MGLQAQPFTWDEALTVSTVRYQPNIIEWVTDERFLNRPNLYPRQGTFLKIIFLQDHLFTQYDYDVIGEWSQEFWLPPVSDEATTVTYQGDWGIQPDVFDRIKILQESGHKWFTTVLPILGRRSSKGYMGALAGSYVLYDFLALEDSRGHYGIDRSKRLAAQVFAGKKMQARDNQWRDLVNVIIDSDFFQDYIGQSLTDTLTIHSTKDRLNKTPGFQDSSGRKRRVDTTMDQSTFEIVPKEATTMAARGPASFMQFYDEMAHMVNTTGGSRSAEEVWESATPSLDQFKQMQFKYCGSSPWQMTGKFYELAQQALQVDADTMRPSNPASLLLQLASWDIYKDWERTKTSFYHQRAHVVDLVHELRNDADEVVGVEVTKEYRPEIVAAPLKGAIQEYNEDMRQAERANPATFRVERRSKWAAVIDQYLPTEHVKRMFRTPEFLTEPLVQKRRGVATIDYVTHSDPGKTSSNFGHCIAHKVEVPGSKFPHVIIDFVHGWMPSDFPNTYSGPGAADNEMDYIAIEKELNELNEAFMPVDVSMDQWNSIGMLQRMKAHLQATSFKTVSVWERDTTAILNWRTAETFKIALALDLVHSPVCDLLEMECTFLQKLSGDKVDHPSSGPVTTKDVYDAASICVFKLLGAEIASAYGEMFSKLSVGGVAPGAALSGPGVDNSGKASVAQAAERFKSAHRSPPKGRPNPARGRRGR